MAANRFLRNCPYSCFTDLVPRGSLTGRFRRDGRDTSRATAPSQWSSNGGAARSQVVVDIGQERVDLIRMLRGVRRTLRGRQHRPQFDRQQPGRASLVQQTAVVLLQRAEEGFDSGVVAGWPDLTRRTEHPKTDQCPPQLPAGGLIVAVAVKMASSDITGHGVRRHCRVRRGRRGFHPVRDRAAHGPVRPLVLESRR